MKQTAIEWLEEKFTNSNADFINSAEEYFEQAKEMEKKQIIDALIIDPYELEFDDEEQYYNETFKK
jgi:spore coat polysaccharide biosynthesis predicted glycosyltransferase SpsG